MYVNFAYYTGQSNRIFLSTRSVLWPKIRQNAFFGQGSAPDKVEGAYDALLGEGTAFPIPQPTQRLRRFDRRAFGARHLCLHPSLVPPLL